MSAWLVTTTLILIVAGRVAQEQPATIPQPAPATQSQAVPASDPLPPAEGLSDLSALTFGCSKASLNAAAREAAKVPSLGTYQFSYFRIVNDSHHAAYEVHFKSNHHAEPELKYCVSIYCQQGWDPRTTKISVALMSTNPKHAGAHGGDCQPAPPPVKRRVKR
jgi:hypothetical protein